MGLTGTFRSTRSGGSVAPNPEHGCPICKHRGHPVLGNQGYNKAQESETATDRSSLSLFELYICDLVQLKVYLKEKMGGDCKLRSAGSQLPSTHMIDSSVARLWGIPGLLRECAPSLQPRTPVTLTSEQDHTPWAVTLLPCL